MRLGDGQISGTCVPAAVFGRCTVDGAAERAPLGHSSDWETRRDS